MSCWANEGVYTELIYFKGELATPTDYTRLAEFLQMLEHSPATRLYPLVTAPGYDGPIATYSDAAGLADQTNGRRNLVIETPSVII